ncbi:MAG: hypothetical protein HYU36_09390 [Planctomycetes bacterium]|nr:hypothetical protein [Planctomycetota bacterium]
MVLIIVLALLAMLVVPALRRTQATAMAADCAARARAIAAAISSYASIWDGWTNPDKDDFVKEMGFKLSSDEGYFGEGPGWYDPDTNPPNASELYASRVKDLRCPADAKPNMNRHGIPQSYVVTSTFGGSNIKSLYDSADRVVALKEAGKRHPSGITRGGVAVDECHYVFADLHVELGYSGPVLPGLRARAWHQGSYSSIKGVAESKLKSPDYETVWTGNLGGDGKWLYVLNQNPAGGQDWNITHSDAQGWSWGGWGQRWPINFCWRWDGVVNFPGKGRYEFNLYQDRYGHESAEIGIGLMGRGEGADSTYLEWFGPPNQGWAYNKMITNVSDPYPVQLLFWSGSDWHGSWSFKWRVQDGYGNYDSLLGGNAGQVINMNYCGHYP